MDAQLRNNLLLFSAGVATHLTVFIRNEWHLNGPKVVTVYCLLLLAALIWSATQYSTSLLQTFSHVGVSAFVYFSGLLSSIVVYRRYFHRIRHFPGPSMAGISKLYHVWLCRDSRNHLVLDELHKKYGNFVRTGPEEITIFHPAAFEALDGAGNKNTRSDWYDIVHPRISPIFSRTEKDHLSRRKVWNHALSDKSIREYLPRINRQINQLERLIEKSKSKDMLLNDVMVWFAFDSMGEFAFNEAFGMMTSEKYHKAIIQQRSALALLGRLNSAIWTVRLAFAFIPNVWRVKDWFGMINFCDSRIQKRLQYESAEPDIASWFIKEYRKEDSHLSPAAQAKLLSGNTVSVIVGGSDTTGPSLIILWYFLAAYPEHTEKAVREIEALDDPTDPTQLATCPHFNGIINESMRLIPAALTMGTRVTPKQGIWLDGTYIPGDIKIGAPRYTIFRLEEAFEQPDEFVPERWYSRPEMIKDARAFAPFSVGRRACVGKGLAMTQLRMVGARILSKYRVRLADGEDGSALLRDMRDQLTASPGECRVVFEPR